MPSISGLPAGSAVAGANLFAAVQDGVTNKVTADQIAAYVTSLIEGDGNDILVTGIGSTTALTLAGRFGYTFNVMDFGAVGDGTTDDTAAVRLAVAAWKARIQAVAGVTTYQRATLLFPPGYTFVISGSLNCQFLNGGGSVQMTGALIICKATGKTLFDFLGSYEVWWEGGTIIGDPSNIPAQAIQMARPSNAGFGGFGFQFHNLLIAGKWSRTCVYNCCAEQHTYINCWFLNLQSTGNGVIIDGVNHYGCITDFTNTTCPTDTAQSTSLHTFVGGTIGFGASSILSTGVISLRLYNTYLFGGGTDAGVEFLAVAGVSTFIDIWMDTLVEARVAALKVTRTASGTVTIPNLTVRTGNNASSTALILAGTNVTTLTLTNLTIDSAVGSTTWFSGTVSYPNARINGIAQNLGIADSPAAAPATVSGVANIYVDPADGDLKIKFGDGTVKTIVVDT